MKETFLFIWHVASIQFRKQILLNTYPESLSMTTDNNSLLIHLYIEAKPKGKEELLFLTHLIYQACNCLEFGNNVQQYPLHIACK